MAENSPKVKSWRKKLQDSKNLPRIVVLDEKQKKTYGEGTSVIPAPIEVDEVMRKVPKGKLITINQIAAALAKKHGTDHGDHMAATLFSNIAARAAVEAAEAVRRRYRILWNELTEEPLLRPEDRFAIRARIRRLNELGFSIDEIELVPGEEGRVRLRVALTTRLFHVRELERLTGIQALEGQARLLLNDLREYRAWLEWNERRVIPEREGTDRWLREVFEPTLARLKASIAPERDLVQAYCDLLEHKWLLSEAAGRDVGLEAAIRSYLSLGAPAPEDHGKATALDTELLPRPRRRTRSASPR
jgi:DNA-binding transcriptional MerR regulator